MPSTNPIETPVLEASAPSAGHEARIQGRRSPRTWRLVHDGNVLLISTEPGSHFSVDVSRAPAAQAVIKQALRAEPSPKLEIDSDNPSALETLLLAAGLPPAAWRRRRALPAVGLTAGDQVSGLLRRLPIGLRVGIPLWVLGLGLAALNARGASDPIPAPLTAASNASDLALPQGSWVGLLNTISRQALPAGIAGFSRIELVGVAPTESGAPGGPTASARREIRLALADAEAVPVLGESKAPAARTALQNLEALLTAMPGAISTPRPLDDARGLATTIELPPSSVRPPSADALKASAQAAGLVVEVSSAPGGMRLVAERVPAAIAIGWLASLEAQGPLSWGSLRLVRVTEFLGEPLPEGLIRLEGSL